MVQFREYRGGIEDSIKTFRKFGTGEELIGHIHSLLHPWFVRVDETTVHAQLYDPRPDKRIDWPETWIVTVDAFGVIGMTDSDPHFPPPIPVQRMRYTA